MIVEQDLPGAAGDPHGGGTILTSGRTDTSAVVLLHGRGASAEDILSLGRELRIDGLGLIAPQANGGSWYPFSFLAPIPENQPHLDSALALIEALVASLIAGGLPPERIALLGFSQGACLTLEFIARHPRRYGAVMGLTGGLIGPPGTPRAYAGTLGGTPVFLGANDPDPHVPFERVRETESVLSRMGSAVELRRYPGMPHAVNADELEACRRLLRGMMTHPEEGGR
ncbi:alpha/beta hydrolase [Paludisphaera borealis]|uniref:Phospholipase/carboxylesterase/thioesterase domain-containing protein n=1 Tax=Paludisphaera borealis TaxID=1387353 RepID=A0A1U7CNM8_9BACT|nr:dienelactone hydrolase family protein [Paludisphaera borealis]APW60518.1 hypothetical protein BSF38_01989 [Paludisphaera borealis]